MSLDEAMGRHESAESILIDNGSTDETASVLARWAAGKPRRVVLSVPAAGKSRALNAARQVAGGTILAFTDDDVEIDAGWLAAISRFFRDHPEYDGGVGHVLRGPIDGPGVEDLLQRFSTLAFFAAGTEVRDCNRLHGANMAVRRRVFERIGGFNERLGPGASGGLEDIELGERLRAAGFRIGAMPEATVVHAVDVARLTRENLLRWHLAQAHSLMVKRPEGAFWHALPRWFEALGAYAIRSVTGSLRRDHAWGRVLRYTEVLRLSLQGPARRGAAGLRD